MFNIDDTIKLMVKAIKDEVANKWSLVKDSANDFLQDHKYRLEELATARINGDIDDDFLQRRLADEEDILKAELLAERIIAKSIAQQAANAAMDVLSKAIDTAIKAL